MEKTTLKIQLESFEKDGIVLDSDGTSSKCFGFYDWFCKEGSLKNKSESLMKKTKTFIDKMDVDVENTYVFFKNNCPMNGPLYDDFRICDVETGDVVWTVIPKCGHSGKAEVWGSKNNFAEAIYVGETLREIYSNLKH